MVQKAWIKNKERDLQKYGQLKNSFFKKKKIHTLFNNVYVYLDVDLCWVPSKCLYKG